MICNYSLHLVSSVQRRLSQGCEYRAWKLCCARRLAAGGLIRWQSSPCDGRDTASDQLARNRGHGVSEVDTEFSLARMVLSMHTSYQLKIQHVCVCIATPDQRLRRYETLA